MSETARLIQKILSSPLIPTADYSGMTMQPKRGDFAKYLLNHASGDKVKKLPSSISTKEGADSEEPGLLSRLIETLSSSAYTVSNIADDLMDDDSMSFEDFGHDVTAGATRLLKDTLLKPATKIPFGIGDKVEDELNEYVDKHNAPRTMADNLGEHLGVENKWLKYGGGLALDIATDPLTFVGGLGLASKGKRLEDVSEELTRKAATSETIKPFVKPTARQEHLPQKMFTTSQPKFKLPEPLPVAQEAVSRPMLPSIGRIPKVSVQGKHLQSTGLLRREKDLERRMAKRGVVFDPAKGVSVRSATELVDEIVTGRRPAFNPAPVAATGKAASTARQIADDFIDSQMNQARTANNRYRDLNTRKFAARRKPLEISPSGQVALFNKVLHATQTSLKGKKASSINSASLSMLRAAEDHLIALGVQPIWHNGQRVRLSDVMEYAKDASLVDVLNSFGRKNMKEMHPSVKAGIEGALASRSVAISDLVANATSLATKASQTIFDTYPSVEKVSALKALPDDVAKAIESSLTKEEMDSVKDIVRHVIDVNKLSSEKFMEDIAKELMQAVSEGRTNPETLKKIWGAMIREIGESPEKLAKEVSKGKGFPTRVVDSFMVNMTTHWGRGILKNDATRAFLWGRRNAEIRAQTMRGVLKKYTGPEIVTAFRVAQGLEDIADPRALELAQFFNRYFEAMLGLSDDARKATNVGMEHLSVAERSMMVMDDVNRHLRASGSNFQFTNSKRARDAVGNAHDFSDKGLGWMQSWRTYFATEKTDPVSFLYDLDLALEKTVREYTFLDDFANRFGTLVPDAEHTYKMPLSRINGFFVNEEIGKQMMRLQHDLENSIWRPKNQATQIYGRGLRAWKTGVTIYLPSHHIRNLIGDLHLMWWAGHNDPRNFIRARRIMHAQRSRYKEAINSGNFDEVNKLTNSEAMEWAKTRGGDVILKQKGLALTADQIYIAAHQRGLLLDANRIEDIFGEAPLRVGGKDFKPFGGHAHNTASSVAEYREHYVRLSHFVGALNKRLKASKGKVNLNKILDEAADEVKKWHPDGTDLTTFEQRIRYLVPFYSWTRKALPLVVQAAVQRPAKVLFYPRANLALQQALGVEGVTIGDPFPDDQLFPEWIRETGIGPIGDPESDNGFSRFWGNLGNNSVELGGLKTGYSVVNPSNPFQDLTYQLGGMGRPQDLMKGIFNTLTPALKVPYELQQGRKFNDAPIYYEDGGYGALEYLTEQIPLVAPFDRVTDLTKKISDRDIPPGRETGTLNTEALINLLTALGLRGTGPWEKSAELEAKDRKKLNNGS